MHIPQSEFLKRGKNRCWSKCRILARIVKMNGKFVSVGFSFKRFCFGSWMFLLESKRWEDPRWCHYSQYPRIFLVKQEDARKAPTVGNFYRFSPLSLCLGYHRTGEGYRECHVMEIDGTCPPIWKWTRSNLGSLQSHRVQVLENIYSSSRWLGDMQPFKC